MGLISKAEFARRMGVSRQYIGKLVKSGFLPADAAGKLDAEACAVLFQTNRQQSDRNTQQWIQEQRGQGAKKAAKKRTQGDSRPDQEREPDPPPAAAPDKEITWGTQYQKARAAAQAIKARREDLELKQLEGLLIEVKSVKHQIETIANIVRTRLNKLPSKYAGRLEGLTTIEIQETLETAIYEILSEFQDMAAAVKQEIIKNG